MSDGPIAFIGTYSALRHNKERGIIQVIVEVPIAMASDAYEVLGGFPVPGKERWLGVTVLTPQMAKAYANERQKAPQQSWNSANQESEDLRSTAPDGEETEAAMGAPDEPVAMAEPDTSWDRKPPSIQIQARCCDLRFRQWMTKKASATAMMTEGQCATAINALCGVQNRKEIIPGSIQATKWKDLDDEFQRTTGMRGNR